MASTAEKLGYKPEGKLMSPEEMFMTWCCGSGMLVTVRSQEDVNKLVAIMNGFNIEAQVAGRVIETPKGKNPHLSIDMVDTNGKPKEVEIS